MPAPKNKDFKHCMAGTLTFNSYYTLRQKTNRLKTIVPDFQQNVCFFRNFNMEWMIEYHKVDGEDDLEAPHVHFMVWIERPYQEREYRAVLAYLSKRYGRSQFFSCTGKKSKSYYKYMQKDREKYPDNYHFFSSTDGLTPQEQEEVLKILREPECV